jgi:hypothetical protein
MSDHTNLPCELLTSLLRRGIQMGEMSKLGRLIGSAKHAICADSLSKNPVIPSVIHHRQNPLEATRISKRFIALPD